jgi:predicted nucleic acid-binding protein
MRAFDASSMIYAWDNYPVEQFPGLWEWMASQIEAKELAMPNVAFEEVQNKTPDCGEWLKENNLEQLAISNAILQDAKRIKDLLGIMSDNYHAKGVGENDLLIIATARLHGVELVSDEERQPTLPRVSSKRKIPAVCAMQPVSVSCINFIEYIKASGEVFR